MTPIVVQVTHDLDEREYLSVNSRVSRASVLVPLTCTPNAEPFSSIAVGQLRPELVRDAGAQLYANVMKHPAVRDLLTAAAIQDPAGTVPFYIELKSDRAENLPWEALFDPGPDQGFFALARRPIGRLVESLRPSLDVQRPLPDPIRILAVISAAGIPAADMLEEWNRLTGALRAAKLKFVVHVITGLTELNTAVLAFVDPDITATVEMIDDDRSRLLARIAHFAPQVLHFFCHGRSNQDGSNLLIATRADIVEGTGGSIALEEADFEPADMRQPLWAAVLNCCELAAAPGEQLQSLARSLVRVGVPAVIAMREPIATWVAHTFTECFYRSLFERVGAILATGDQPPQGDIEWASVLSTARGKLVASRAPAGTAPSRAARELKEWILPALYARTPQLRVLRVDDEARRVEIHTLETFLAQLGRAPASVRDSIQQQIDMLRRQLQA